MASKTALDGYPSTEGAKEMTVYTVHFWSEKDMFHYMKRILSSLLNARQRIYIETYDTIGGPSYIVTHFNHGQQPTGRYNKTYNDSTPEDEKE